MSNIDNPMNISIEQIAAFLDGNLPEEEMQTVADTISSNEMYSDFMSTVMDVDDYMEQIDPNESMSVDIPDVDDFVLPEIPSLSADIDTVDVVPVSDDDSVVTVVSNDSTPHLFTMDDDVLSTTDDMDENHVAFEDMPSDAPILADVSDSDADAENPDNTPT